MPGSLISEDIFLLLNFLGDGVSIVLQYSIPGSWFSTVRFLNILTMEEISLWLTGKEKTQICGTLNYLSSIVRIVTYAYFLESS